MQRAQCAAIASANVVPLRLVVNTHGESSGRVALYRLLTSLIGVGFEHWQHVLVVVGGLRDYQQPVRKPLARLLRSICIASKERGDCSHSVRAIWDND